MTSLLYYFDLGNTRCKFWRVRDGRIEAHVGLAHGGDPAGILAGLGGEFASAPARICGVSVLGAGPDQAFATVVRGRWALEPEFAVAEASFRGLVNAYQDKPGQLGVDRWMGLIAAVGECEALCVVSCGTAVTIDVLAGLQHMGGYILPGLALMQEALHQGTRRVRVMDSPDPSPRPGTNTDAAVRNGALAAVVALVDRVAAEVGATRVVLTGGDALRIAPHLHSPQRVEAELLLKGMMRYFDDRRGPPPEGMPPEGRG